MQIFGKFSTNFDMDYLVEEYIYINQVDENHKDIKITINDFKNMLTKKRKTVAGTIFLFNPTLAPIGYKNDVYLKTQEFEQYDEYIEIEPDAMSFILGAGLKKEYKGKLVEVKYLFNLNKPNIEPTPILEEFDADLDKFTSTQLTRYDKQLNYLDIPNMRLTGKFVFFGIGNKYDRHHKNIIAYAKALSEHVNKLDKTVVFMHDNNYDADECKELAYFLSPFATGKMREKRANGIKEVFKTVPPHIVKIS